MEKFNPFNPAYKKLEDLPVDEQVNFKPAECGFVKNTAFENIDEVRSDEEFIMEAPTGAERDNEKIEEYEQLLGVKEAAEIRGTISVMYDRVKTMIEPVIEHIKNGDYQLLICDDSSGRIPTLIVQKLINKANLNASRPNIDTRFIAGTTIKDDNLRKDYKKYKDTENQYISYGHAVQLVEQKKQKVLSYISLIKKQSVENITRALIVTDYIKSGGGLDPVTEALKKNDIAPTILTVQINSQGARPRKGVPTYFYQNLEKHGDIHFGKMHDAPPGIYRTEHIAGVEKHFSDLHAEPIRLSLSDDEKKIVFAKMAIARDEANNLANLLIAELLNSPK